MKFLPLFALVTLTACVSFKAKPLTAEQTSADFNSRTLSDPGLRAFLAENKAASGSWSVNRLSLAAAYFHPDVALACAEAEEAAAGIKTAQMRPNPVFTFSPQYASFRAPVPTPWFFGPSLSIPIETAGKRSKRTEQALAIAEAARWRVSSRAWAARSRVRAAIWNFMAPAKTSACSKPSKNSTTKPSRNSPRRWTRAMSRPLNSRRLA